MPSVLSTKKLALNQKELLLNSGIGLVEYDAISIEFLDFNLQDSVIQNAVFSSRNAIEALEGKATTILNCFCVGEKTSALAREKGCKVLEQADNAEELAKVIIENYKDKRFTFFCGNRRRDELPQLLRINNIHLNEITVYTTSSNRKEFKSDFDGILFFSPSAVESFTLKNCLNTTAFCIGETTAAEARKYTDNIIVATRPGIENVIAKVVSNLKNTKITRK